MIKNDRELLLVQLAKQIEHAHSMDGAWGEEMSKARRAACEAANSTVAMLEAMGMDPEEAMEKAEAMAWKLQLGLSTTRLSNLLNTYEILWN